MYLTKRSKSTSITEHQSSVNQLTYRNEKDSMRLSLTRANHAKNKGTALVTENKNQSNLHERVYLTDASDFFSEILMGDDTDKSSLEIHSDEDYKLKKESLTNKYNRKRG